MADITRLRNSSVGGAPVPRFPFLTLRPYARVDQRSAPARLGLTLELTDVAERRAVNLLDDQLADWHARIERDIKRTEVDQLERDSAVKFCMDRGGCEVDQ